MRRLTIFLIVAAMATACFGAFPADIVTNRGAMFGMGVNDPFLKWARTMDNLVSGGTGTGKIFYVDSGVSNAGDGTSWTNAVATIDEGINLCENNRGDVILVAQGHAEAFTAADDADADVIGISIIGMGTGTNRPTLTYTANGELVIGAANVLVANIIFAPGAANVTHAIEIEADADFSVIQFCEFQSGSTDAFEFVDAIQLATAADDITIQYNNVIETTIGANSWIDATTGIVNNLQIIGNRIGGDYAEAPIESDKACTDMLIKGNIITNLNSGDHAIELSGNATGIIVNNILVTDDPTNVIDAGYCECMGNQFGDYDANIDSDFGPRWLTTATSDVTTVIDMTPEIADDSILAWMLTSDGDISGYNETTDSQEAIADAIAALSGVGLRSTCEVNAGGAGFFTSVGLAGYGEDFFNTGWYVIVTRDNGSAGAAPEGEVRDIVDYVSATGVFTIAPDTSAAITTSDSVMLVRVEEMNFDSIATLGGSGRIIYVDSGVAGTADVGDLGDTWDLAYPTIAAAIAGATASNGDVIYVAAGHSETLAAAVAMNVAGVTIIGLGEGSLQPTMDCSVAAAQWDISVANVSIENIKFSSSRNDVLRAIDLAAGADGTHIKNCTFVDSNSSDEFLEIIVLASGADDVIIEGCEFLAQGTSGTEAIIAEAGACDNLQIIGNRFLGDWSVSAIWSNQINTNCLIKDNVIHNITTGQHCIELTAASTGDIVGNTLYGDTEGAILDSGSMIPFGNNIGVVLDVEALPGWVIDQDLNHLMETAVADVVTPFDMTAEVPNNTVLANIMTDDGDTSGYNETTDSLEAIGTYHSTMTERCISKTLTSLSTPSDDLFAVTGGPIKIVEIVTYVTVQMEAKETLVSYNIDPTDPATDTLVGSTGTALDVTGDAIGTLWMWDGVLANNLIEVTNGVAVAMGTDVSYGLIVPIGMIELASSATNTGDIVVSMRYIPLSPDAVVTAQ